MAPFSFLFAILLYALTAGATALGAQSSAILPKAGSLEHVPDFGSNPTKVSMYIYVPKKLAAKPGIVVAIHYCEICRRTIMA
jgi:acetylxylan esterase